MKKINALLTLAALASPLFYMGCSSDVYDPDKTIVEPTPNPIGQGFSAPDGFKWSMINTVKLNVAVKDEFSGAYKYLVEVFTSSPLNNTSITPIAAGLTNSSYSTDVAISTDIKKLYIRQTDPKGRKEIYEYAVPEGGGTLTANLFYTPTTTKAFSTRATGSTDYAYNNAGITEPSDPNYKESESFPPLPSSSDGYYNKDNPGKLADGAKFIIGTEYTENNPFTIALAAYSGKATVFVKGVWKLSNGTGLNTALDIYVLNGGKIIGDGNLTFGSQTNLYVQTGGKVVVNNGQFNLKSKQTKNFGTIEVKRLLIDENIELFNANTITASGDDSQINGNNAIVINRSKMIFSNKVSLTNASILNTSGAEIKAYNLYLNSGKVFNHGAFTVDNELSCNGGISTKLINRHDANITINKISVSLAVYNDGFMTVTDYLSNESDDVLYNSCTIIIKNSFKFLKINMDKGSISAGKANDSDTWLPIPTITAKNSAAINLQNGSMIKATLFNGGNTTTFTGNGSDPSIIAAQKFVYTGNTHISGNLVWSVTDDNPSQTWMKDGYGIPNTGYDESKYTIETCGGFYNQGNQGDDHYIPTVPTINDASIYTYAFEDNWPVYGDFDMNDLVVALKNKSVSSDGKTVTFNLSLEAVGATKQLGLGIRIMNLSATPTVTVNSSPVTLESDKTFIVFTDAHKEFGYNDSRPFINTVKGASTNKTAIDYTVSLAFSSAISASAFNINNFDTFIISKAADKTKRTEVHLAGYPATGEGNTSQYGKGNDNSNTSGNYYLSKENLAWAIVVPADFKWPLEFKKATDAYSNLESWVTSGGKENTDWYKHSTSGSVYE